MNLIIFCMAVIGLTGILLESSLFGPVRSLLQGLLPAKIYEVFECHQCMGTWVGFLLGWLLIAQTWWMVLICGFMGSFLCATHHKAFVLFEEWVLSQTNIDINVNEGNHNG
jgi:hypothetical protein